MGERLTERALGGKRRNPKRLGAKREEQITSGPIGECHVSPILATPSAGCTKFLNVPKIAGKISANHLWSHIHPSLDLHLHIYPDSPFFIFVLTATDHFDFSSDFHSYIFFSYFSLSCDKPSGGRGLSPSTTSSRTILFILVDRISVVSSPVVLFTLQDMFELVGGLVENFLAGFNSFVFVYGQIICINWLRFSHNHLGLPEY
ncbi:uncharacterized protein LOC122276963 [Carya illinoinensis]|uniref:uncharacterized protein LOC122276963 n=1 Tax=Carya illinoinensis TaxID=32201 RepID=UPI001C718BA8|nr:uncharacterized protein LOC122276963 [Carya illinoinensis]